MSPHFAPSYKFHSLICNSKTRLAWSCRIHGHVDDEWSMGDRYWQLCQEGNAARWLLVALFIFQGMILVKHAVAYRNDSDMGRTSWVRQRSSSQERIVAPEEE